MKWFNADRTGHLDRSHSNPEREPGDRRSLRQLLECTTLDELVGVVCSESAAALNTEKLLVIALSPRQGGRWSMTPKALLENEFGDGLLDGLMEGFRRPSVSSHEASVHDTVRAYGFGQTQSIVKANGFALHFYWAPDGVHPPPEPSVSANLWSDLELVLDNLARFEELRELSHIDALTGVFNRRYFNLRLQEEAARAQRFNRHLSLVVADLDRFKNLNDSHGHQAGDVVLRYLAQTIRRSVRSIDIVCRLGGDEFAILMPDTEARECETLGDRLKRAVSAGGFTLRGRGTGGAPLDLKVALGAAVFPEHADRPERLLWCADMALLEAKRHGGDRLVLSDPSHFRHGSAL